VTLRNVVRASGSFKLASGALQIGFIIIIIISIEKLNVTLQKQTYIYNKIYNNI